MMIKKPGAAYTIPSKLDLLGIIHKMRNLILIIVICGLSTSACEDDSNDNRLEYQYNHFIIAGSTDTLSVLHVVLNPEVYMTNSFGNSAMLDLDNDAMHDLLIGMRGEGMEIPDCPCDSGILCDCWPNPYFEKYLQCIDNMEIAVTNNDGHKAVVALKQYDTVDYRLNWDNDHYSHTLRYLSPTNDYGFWSDSSDNFAGFRICRAVDTTYGWIRINIRDGISVLDYATNRSRR